MQKSLKESQQALFTLSNNVTTHKTFAVNNVNRVEKTGVVANSHAKPTMQLGGSMSSQSKAVVAPQKQYTVFSSSNSSFATSQPSTMVTKETGSKVARSQMKMSAGGGKGDIIQRKETLPSKYIETITVKKNPAGQFTPIKYIEKSIGKAKEPIVEIVTEGVEEADFEVKGDAIDSLAAGHLDTEFGHSCKAIISPSLLACDQGNMTKETIRAVEAGAEMIHFDIMDGNFVSNLTWGPGVVSELRKHTDVHFDCHVQITNPINWIETMADAGADTFTFHLEAMYDIDSEGNEVYDVARCNEKTYEMINAIRNASRKMKVGMTIRTDTPVERLKPFLDSDDVDTVMIMCIPLGFGGQPFNADMMEKVRWLRQNYPTLDIEVDGGLGPKTIEQAATAGANIIVAGSAVYGQDELSVPIAQLKRAVEKFGNKMDEADLTPIPVIGHDDHDKQQSSGDD